MRRLLSLHQWDLEYDQLREKSIESTVILRRYERGTSQVYGEINTSFVQHLIRELDMQASDVFVDIGSGVGNVVLQMAAQTGCRASGIEIRRELADIASDMLAHLRLAEQSAFPTSTSSVVCEAATLSTPGQHARLGAVGGVRRAIGDLVELNHGDATSDALDLRRATVVFVNNYCFQPDLELRLLHKFARELAPGTRVVSLKDFCPRYRAGPRYQRHPCAMFRHPWHTALSLPDSVSWDSKPIAYYVYTVQTPLDVRPDLLVHHQQPASPPTTSAATAADHAKATSHSPSNSENIANLARSVDTPPPNKTHHATRALRSPLTPVSNAPTLLCKRKSHAASTAFRPRKRAVLLDTNIQPTLQHDQYTPSNVL
jgi:hypothetical protein